MPILFFVGKTSYYMVTPATSFSDADSNSEKLVGGGKGEPTPQENTPKTFFLVQGTPEGYETSAGLLPTDYLRPEFFILGRHLFFFTWSVFLALLEFQWQSVFGFSTAPAITS